MVFLEVFYILNDSMILWFVCLSQGAFLLFQGDLGRFLWSVSVAQMKLQGLCSISEVKNPSKVKEICSEDKITLFVATCSSGASLDSSFIKQALWGATLS